MWQWCCRQVGKEGEGSTLGLTKVIIKTGVVLFGSGLGWIGLGQGWAGFVFVWGIINERVRLLKLYHKDHSCNNYKNGGADL